MTVKTDSNKKTPFAWTDANTKTASDLYLACIKDKSLADANSKNELQKIADAIGAKSAQSVRSKLTNSKVYQKCEDTGTKASAKVKPTKVATVRNVESVLCMTKNSLDTLDKGNASALEALLKRVIELGTDEAITTAYDALQERLEVEAVAKAEAEKEAEKEA